MGLLRVADKGGVALAYIGLHAADATLGILLSCYHFTLLWERYRKFLVSE